MSTSAPERTGREGGSWWAGRSGLVLAALMALFGTYVTVGAITMDVPGSAEPPGPRFFPTILAVVCFALAALLVLHYVRTPEEPEDTEGTEAIEDRTYATFTDWRALGLTVAGFVLFTALLNPLGWIIAAAIMFWVIAYAMGSRNPVQDIAIALVVSCAVQVVFSMGLGLNLPAGILEGIL